MGKFMLLTSFAVFAYFVAMTEGKQYMDLKCHPDYSGEERAMEIEEKCRTSDTSGAECYRNCVLKELGIVQVGSNGIVVGEFTLIGIGKLFSQGSTTTRKLFETILTHCPDMSYDRNFVPCVSSSEKYYDCFEEAVGCAGR